MATKNSPGQFDCYANAEPDEPMFILLGRDFSSGELVREWAHRRFKQVASGVKPREDLAMVEEAIQCAAAMDAWAMKKYRIKHGLAEDPSEADAEQPTNGRFKPWAVT